MLATRSVVAIALVTGIAAGSSHGQCGASGADLLLTDLTAATNYTPSPGGSDAASFGSLQTNVGSAAMTSNISTALHPVQAPNFYRLTTSGGVNRFEQIGMGWAFHAGVPLNQGGFCTCEGGGGASIGSGCSDPHSASAAGSAANLGPRWQVNATTGVFAHPYATPSGANAGRLQFAVADVAPALNPGALYFAEVVVVHPEDAAAGNAANNASTRPALATLAGDNPVISLGGSTRPGVAAIQLWKEHASGVVEVTIDVEGDGRFIVAARAVRLGGNLWDYEYAVFNLNSHRSAGSFTVPMPQGAAAVTAGFHDVSYHSGDGPGGVTLAGTDWVFTQSADAATWRTDDFAANEAANALRWGTMYNFRLRGPVAPEPGHAVIGLFRPGTPEEIAAAVPVPGRPSCLGDHDGDGQVGVADIFSFLGDWFADLPAGDAVGDGSNGVTDIFAFLASWFSGC